MKKHIKDIALAAAALLLAIVTVIGPLFSLDAFITDNVYSHLAAPNRNIVVIGIDEETLSEYGNMSMWLRSELAELLDTLYSDPENAPSVVGLDFLITDEAEAESDEALVNSIVSNDADVVLATNIVHRVSFEPDATGKLHYDPNFISDIEMPFDELGKVTLSGFSNAAISADGCVRSSENTVSVPDHLKEKADSTHDSFAFAVYKKYCENNGTAPNVPKTEKSGRFRFLYTTKSGGYSHISFKDVSAGKIQSNVFKDSIVLVGAYAPGFQDAYRPASDRGTSMYGVEIHANIIQAYMRGATMTDVPPIVIGIVCAAILALFLWFSRKKSLASTLVLSGVLIALYLLAGRFLSAHGLYIPCAYMLIAIVLADVYYIIDKYVAERIRRRRTLDVFKKYVAPEVVDKLSKTGDFVLHLGGERREVAVLFVDIRGFTTLSEKLEPETVVSILNEYLAHVTDCVLAHKGTLDKFIGDAAMAIFNAPFDQEDYVYEAVSAAWDISMGSEKIEKELFEKFGQTVRFGVGVNMGPATVGNIGCDFRMDYTAIGDTVNTAARLEANAGPGQILISNDVRQTLGDRIGANSVGELSLKGKSNKIEIFEVTSMNG